MGKSQIVKGHGYEREIARRFRAVLGSARRGLQYRDGAECADVVTPIFHIECKRHKRTNPKSALNQAIRTCEAGKYPVGVCKDDYKEDTVTMLLDDFLDLVRDWWEAGTK